MPDASKAVPQMAFCTKRWDDVHVVVSLHTAVQPLDEHWAAYEEALRVIVRGKRPHEANFAHLVFSDGAAPNALQRRTLHDDIFAGQPFRLGVVSDALGNPLVRGVATAVSWMNPLSIFRGAEQLREVLSHLGLSQREWDVWELCRALQLELPRVHTLARAASLCAHDAPECLASP